jgi:hypothetical protein
MRRTHHPDRPFSGMSVEEITTLAKTKWLNLETLFELHREVCLRKFVGWDSFERELKARYEAMSRRNLDLELKAMEQIATHTPQKAKKEIGANSPQKVEPAKTIQVAAPTITTSTRKPPMTWEDAAKQIRHATVHPEAKNVQRLRGANDWSDASPLKLFGYSVNATTGLKESDRSEFLADFCKNAELPKSLPTAYSTPWGEPNSKQRIMKTAKHLRFLIRNAERRDDLSMGRAISCWQRDFDFLKSHFKEKLNASEWLDAWTAH